MLATPSNNQNVLESVTVTVQPTVEPVTVSEAKAHLRLDSDFTDDDATLLLYISAAREALEKFTGLTFTSKTHVARYSSWGKSLTLPYPPIVSVTGVAYIEKYSGVSTTLTLNTGYFYANGELTFPILYNNTTLQVTYTSGYGAGNEPALVKLAILQCVASWYENRGEVQIGNLPSVAKDTVSSISKFRNFIGTW